MCQNLHVVSEQGLEAKLDATMEAVAGLHPSTSPSGKQLTLLKDLTRKQDKKVTLIFGIHVKYDTTKHAPGTRSTYWYVLCTCMGF